MNADRDDAEFDELLDDFETLTSDGRFVGAKVILREIEARVGENDPEAFYARGLLAWRRDGAGAEAEEQLRRAVEADPDFSDARYALGSLYDLEGNFEGMRTQLLEVLRLDALQAEPVDRETLDEIEAIARECLAVLPEEFRARLENVPVVLEERPHEALVADGFDPRALGLFEGLEDSRQHDLPSAPTRIVLYYSNLVAAFPDPDDLAEEIEVTLFHEIGHFFGLDEEEVAELGLA